MLEKKWVKSIAALRSNGTEKKEKGVQSGSKVLTHANVGVRERSMSSKR
jgi:hypothetical protein